VNNYRHLAIGGMAAAAAAGAVEQDVPLLVRVLAGNPVTSTIMLSCLNTDDARRLRCLHPAVPAVVAGVPWCDLGTHVVDAARWCACFPAAAGAWLKNRAATDLLASEPAVAALRGVTHLDLRGCAYVSDDVILRLPTSLHLLNVRSCHNLTAAASVAHLPALQLLDASCTAVGDALVASLPATLVELQLMRCRRVTASVTLDHLHALRVLHCIDTELSPAALAGCRERGCVVAAASVLRGHTTRVWSLALLVGGRLASGDDKGTVRLWDAAHGDEAAAVLEGNGGEVQALVALPDGRRLAAGVHSIYDGQAGTIVVWDTGVTPPTRCATIGCSSGVHALAVLRDGRLAVGCENGGVQLVEVGEGAGGVVGTMVGHTNVVRTLAVLPDGMLASGSWDATVRLWDVGARECVATLAGHTGYIHGLAVLPDGRLASGSSDFTVRLWDVATRACVGVLRGHTWSVWVLAALPDGQLASGSGDKTIRVWDTRPSSAGGAGCGTAGVTPVVVLGWHTASVTALRALSDGRLASGGGVGDNTVRLWPLPSLQ